MIEITSPEQLKCLLWVLKAYNPKYFNNSRHGIACLHVEEGAIVATNGGALHLWETDLINLPEGDYDIVSMSKKLLILKKRETSLYPNWRQVVPTKYTGFEKLDFPSANHVSYVSMATDALLDPELVLNALGYGTLTTTKKGKVCGLVIEYEEFGQGKDPVIIRPMDSMKAVVVPIRFPIKK